MKKNYLFASIFAIVALNACGHRNATAASNMDDSTVIIDGPNALPAVFVAELETQEKKAESHFIADPLEGEIDNQHLYKYYEVEWPTRANFNIEPLQKALNKAMFNQSITSFDTAARGFLNTPGADFDDFDFKLTKSATKSENASLNYGHWIACTRVTSQPSPTNVVVFVAGGNIYMGGAHGMPYQCGVINYDCNQECVIEYSDIFVTGSDSKILSMLKKTRKNMEGADPSLLPTRIPKDMMFIYADKVTFAYAAYEIGCYAEGEIELTLTRAQIEPYLTNYGHEIFSRPTYQ